MKKKKIKSVQNLAQLFMNIFGTSVTNKKYSCAAKLIDHFLCFVAEEQLKANRKYNEKYNKKYNYKKYSFTVN